MAALRNAVLILVLLLVVAAYFVWQHFFAYGTDTADLAAYFDIRGENDYPVIIDGEEPRMHATQIDGAYYVTTEDLYTIAPDFYMDDSTNALLYTTAIATWSCAFNETVWRTDDGREGTLEQPIVITEGESTFINLDYVRALSPMRYTIYHDPAHIKMELETNAYTVQAAKIKKDTNLRLRGGIKSEILRALLAGERVRIVEEMDTWTKVCTEDAFTGYVENKFLSDITEEEREGVKSELESINPQEFDYRSNKRPFRVSLAWHALYSQSGNDTLERFAGVAAPMNVISPTWIYVSDTSGAVTHYCDSDYIRTAHNLGLEVWAVVDNFTNDIDTLALLSGRAGRASLIDSLLMLASQYGFEGINVDFEQVPATAGRAYAQFIRELSVRCRKEGVVLSVDVPPPMEYNSHYAFATLGKVCDYCILMGYDEHHRTSEVAGSVASIDFVREGIEGLLQVMDAEKIVNALPFYTRFWITGGDEGIKSISSGIRDAYANLEKYGITLSWDDATGQNYGEAMQPDGTFVQVWMEDETSIAEKLSVMETLGITNVAAWRLGFESTSIWDEINAFLTR